jgi:hypothetical protein
VNFTQQVNFSLLDLSGKFILEDKSNKLETNDLPKGMYLLRYENKTEKLVIQ